MPVILLMKLSLKQTYYNTLITVLESIGEVFWGALLETVTAGIGYCSKRTYYIWKRRGPEVIS